MEIQLTPDVEAKLDQLAIATGRPRSEFVQDALEGYLDDLIVVREMLDRRYDEITSGKVKPIPSADVFRRLREKSDALRSQP
jgi:predicted transcriptional regulator